MQTLAEGFGDLRTSPYHSRVFVVLDEKHDAKKSSLARLGVHEDNIQVWTRNGIEWYYPKQHVAAAFRCSEAELNGVDLEKDRIIFNSIPMSKKELAQFVVQRITPEDNLDPEVTTFLNKVKRVII